MNRLEHIAKTVLLALAGLSLVVVVIAWALKLHADASSHVASLRSEMLFVTALCFGVVVACVIPWIWMRQFGLARAVAAILGAAVISVVPLGGTAIAGARQIEMTAIPGNLPYDFLARHSPCQYTTWSTPATSIDVEEWRIERYGFPEPFLHVCNGTSVAGQYVMLDKVRLALDWLLAFDAALVVVAAFVYVARRRRAA